MKDKSPAQIADAQASNEKPNENAVAVVSPGSTFLQQEVAEFEFQQRKAKLLSRSTMVPKEFQGDNGIPNILVAMEMAHRMSMPLMAIIQNIVIIHNRPSWKSSFLVAVINLSKKFGPLKYERGTMGKAKHKSIEFENISCRVVVTDREGNKLEGPFVTMEMAHKDGWTANEKWQSIPETMLQWRAVSFFSRAVCPELTLGLPSSDELDLVPEPGHTTYSSDPDFRRPRIEATPKVEISPSVVGQGGQPPNGNEQESNTTPIDELIP